MLFNASFWIVLVVAASSIAIGSMIWMSDHSSAMNRAFLAIIGTAACWSILTVISFSSHSGSVIRVTSDLAAGLSYAMVLAGVVFSEAFLLGHLTNWVKYILLPLSIPLLWLFSSNYTCGPIDETKNCSGGPGYPYLLIAICFCFIVLTINCIRATRNASIEKSRQAKIVLVGMASSIMLGILVGYLLPLYGITRFNIYYPILPFLFIATVFYGIARHHLFNLRLFIARSVAYVMTLGVLAVLFGIVVLGTAKYFFQLHVSASAEIYISSATALAALGFSRLKSFFDTISNGLFYHDAYDSQQLLEDLNRLFVENTNTEQLLKRSASMLTTVFKAEYCFFGLHESEYVAQRFVGTNVKRVSAEDVHTIRKLSKHLHHKIIVTSELETDHQPLRDILTKYGIAVLGILTTNTNQASDGLGFLMLGHRRSGNPYSIRDVRTLETIANELVIASENSLRFEQIQHFNETLQGTVDEATRKLRRTNEKLQGLDATKDEFITMASHQLRTPLTAVKGYLSMVLEGDAGKLNANQRKLLEQSYISSQRMVYLIADLLNLSRLSTGKFIIDQSPINLADIVQAEINQLTETAKSREITLQYQRPDSFPELMLDETKTHQVVMNFIDNAIYYTPAGGSITVELRETATSVEFAVQDTGIGIAKAEQHHLFTKFFRAENAKRARPDGTGLGLFMAKKIIVAQNGAILFESVEGKGSMFGFRFNKHGHAVPTISDNETVTTKSVA